MVLSAKLDNLSKWAMSTNSNNTNKFNDKHQLQIVPIKSQEIQPYNKGRSKFTAISEKERYNEYLSTRPYEKDLINIRSTSDIIIDFNKALSIKKGDLAIIQGEVFRCTPALKHLRNVSLVLKRLECIDRRIYDLKVYESDTFMRFRGNPNIISLYSYWSEPASNPYAYKTLIQLYEEGIYGDMLRTVVLNPIRPSNRLVFKYLCDISKALVSIHNANLIHAAIKPTNIYISNKNTAMVGEFKKVELDSARQTHQLFSKILIGYAIPKTLIYWAPELIKMEKYGPSVDLWSLGVTLYQILTGEHPFNVTNEDKFRTDVFNGNVDWSRLEGFIIILHHYVAYPKIKKAIENLLKVIPEKRWTSHQLLEYCQNDFAIDIQRTWKGYLARKEYKRVRNALIKIQANIKGWLTRIHYVRDKILLKENAAIMIQKKFRAYLISKSYRKARKLIMKCQANILTRQMRRAYLKMRLDVLNGQAYIRRYLAIKWFKHIKQQRAELENYMENINEMINKFNDDAKNFKNNFTTKNISAPLKYLQSFEQYELTKAKTFGTAKTHIPNASTIMQQYHKLQDEKKNLINKLDSKNYNNPKQNRSLHSFKDENIQKINNDKIKNLKLVPSEIKKNIKKPSSELLDKSKPLELKIQHPYTYSKWDQIHEPHNIVENVLRNDDSVYKALTPCLDFTLNNGGLVHIKEIYLYPGDCGPANIEIYISSLFDKWFLLREYKCDRSSEQKITLEGDSLGKYLRIKCLNNIRGGNIVSVKQVVVMGILKDIQTCTFQ